MFTENNRVIVRVWTSSYNKSFPGHNVGHVSIETPTSYMSLWPVPLTLEQIVKYRDAKTLEKKYSKYYMERDPDFHQNFDVDARDEGAPLGLERLEPQVVVCLYSLNVDDIESAFGHLQHDTRAWRLVGSNMLLQKLETLTVEVVQATKLFDSGPVETVENCASAALKLLKAGGITNLVNIFKESSFCSQTSSSVSPDKILEILIPAKSKELTRYPETQEYQFQDETPQGAKKPSCSLL